MDKDKIKKSCENFEALPLKAMRAVKEGARFQRDGGVEKEEGRREEMKRKKKKKRKIYLI